MQGSGLTQADAGTNRAVESAEKCALRDFLRTSTYARR